MPVCPTEAPKFAGGAGDEERRIATQILSNINDLERFVLGERLPITGQQGVTNAGANQSRGEWLAVREMVGMPRALPKTGAGPHDGCGHGSGGLRGDWS